MSHYPHLEDLALTREGARQAQTLLRHFGEVLAHEKTPACPISVKIDGSPAVVFGTDPASGQFFVSTKAALNKTPKLMFEDAQVDQFTPEIHPILKTCLRELFTLNAPGMYQGDFLYSRDTIERGAQYNSFKPNTLTYAFDPDSGVGQRIMRAQMGIAIHTEFDKAGKAVPSSVIESTPSVFVLDTRYTFDPFYSGLQEEEQPEYDFACSEAFAAWRRLTPEHWQELTGLNQLQPFLHWRVREGIKAYDVDAMIQGFDRFMEAQALKHSDGLKTGIAKTRVMEQYRRKSAKIAEPWFREWLLLYYTLEHLKRWSLSELLLSVKSGLMPMLDGRYVEHEGLVVEAYNTRIKLVHREVFSKANFENRKFRQ